jgi:hypothetical protein
LRCHLRGDADSKSLIEWFRHILCPLSMRIVLRSMQKSQISAAHGCAGEWVLAGFTVYYGAIQMVGHSHQCGVVWRLTPSSKGNTGTEYLQKCRKNCCAT